MPAGIVTPTTRAESVDLFREWVGGDDPTAVWIRDHVHELARATLACWCPQPGPGHALVLAEMAEVAASWSGQPGRGSGRYRTERSARRHDRAVSGAGALRLEFVLSAARAEQLPDNDIELAIVGRSNVGKSSLLNALANRKQLALVSKTPGRTQLLNCFSLGDGAALIDCPGYGYASVAANKRKTWQKMMEDYLLTREQLAMILVLVDGEIGPTELDRQMLEWLRAEVLPHVVIATKHDKVKASKRDKRKRDLAEACQLDKSDVIWVSAAKGTGIDRLRSLVLEWLR